MGAQPSESSVSGARFTGRLPSPLHPLTIAEYLAIGEIEPGYTELVEGSIVLSPSPVPRHNRAQKRLLRELDDQLPGDLEAIQELDVDLALSGADGPGWSRRPDAGIGHYWVVDLSRPVSLLACHLAGEFGHSDGGVVTGTFTATAPFDVTIDLDTLL